MLYAFYGADGRSAATHAALAAAHALTTAARPATLLRITERGQGLARIPETMPEALCVVEAEPGDLVTFDDPEDLIRQAQATARDVVLDLPLSWLPYRSLREAAALSVVVVGPGAMEERLAAFALGQCGEQVISGRAAADQASGVGPEPGSAAPVWLLGAGRAGGGPDATRFEQTMRPLLRRAGAGDGCRFLPVALPAPTRSETHAVAAGHPLAGTVRQGMLLLAAIEVAAQDPFVASLDSGRFARALGLDPDLPITPDERRLCDRLRDLADALEALEQGGPAPEEMARAPLMESWSFLSGRTRVLAGVSFGHPTIASGRPTLTSDVFATDGRTWARTLSRLYRLGTPAEATPAAGLQ